MTMTICTSVRVVVNNSKLFTKVSCMIQRFTWFVDRKITGILMQNIFDTQQRFSFYDENFGTVWVHFFRKLNEYRVKYFMVERQ